MEAAKKKLVQLEPKTEGATVKKQKSKKGPGPITHYVEAPELITRKSRVSITPPSEEDSFKPHNIETPLKSRVQNTVDFFHVLKNFEDVRVHLSNENADFSKDTLSQLVKKMDLGISTLNKYVVTKLAREPKNATKRDGERERGRESEEMRLRERERERRRTVEKHFDDLNSSGKKDDYKYAMYLNETFISEADRRQVSMPRMMALTPNIAVAPLLTVKSTLDSVDQEIIRKLVASYGTTQRVAGVRFGKEEDCDLDASADEENNKGRRSQTLKAMPTGWSSKIKKAYSLASDDGLVSSTMKRGKSMRMSSFTEYNASNPAPIPVFSVGCDRLLADLSVWTMDVFQLTVNAGGRPLTALGMRVFEDFDLIRTFNIPILSLCKFFMAVEHAYGRFPDVRYHNNQHAADVLYSTQCLLRHPKVRCNLTKLEIISTLIAATLHDIQHPGLDSGFLVATGHDLSLTYNDKSILENHHASFGFRVMKNPTCDILSQMSTDDRKECRKMVIAMILSTDMSAHFGGVMEFEQLVRHKRTPSSSSSDSATDSTRADKTLDGFSSKEVRTLLTSVLHCADLGACTKSWDYSKRWSFRVLGEFWQQGDKEKQKGLPVGPLNDRDKTNIPRSQINFINIIVKPLWECWNQYIGEESVQVNNLLSNHDRWSAVAEEEEAFPREMCPTVRAVEDKEENLDKNLNHSKLNAKPTISNPELVSNGRVATTFHNDGKTTQKRQTVKKLKTTPRIGRKNKIQSTCV